MFLFYIKHIDKLYITYTFPIHIESCNITKYIVYIMTS